jgi:hypothetical protein
LKTQEGPTSTDLLLTSILSFIRIWDRIPVDDVAKFRDSLQVENVGSLLGSPSAHIDEYEFLVHHRKEAIRVMMNTPVALTNSVLRIGKLNQNICQSYETVHQAIQVQSASGKVCLSPFK